MSILYFPSRIYKGRKPAIDAVIKNSFNKSASTAQDITSSALDFTVYSSAENGWELNNIILNFSNAAPKNYTAAIQNGITIVEKMNDYLWFQIPSSFRQKIVLDAGFYTGTELATELQTKLNANTSFSGLGVTFTVTYNNVTGVFNIVPSSGTIKYLSVNNEQVMTIRDSIAGHLFGLNQSTAYLANVSSDTFVQGLNSFAYFINETNVTNTTHLHETVHKLSLDQAVEVQTNTANVEVSVLINYKEYI